MELHLIADLVHTTTFGSEPDHLAYLSIFLNAVSLRLQQLDPPVALCLKSLETATVNESYVALWTTGELLAYETLPMLRSHAWNNSIPNSSDVVYFLTGREMARKFNEGISTTISGLAYFEGVCTGNKIAMGEDKNLTYIGVRTMAHEIGHLLGAEHDGVAPSENCSKKDGFVMTAQPKTKEVFSPCSIKAIASFLKKPNASCLLTEKPTRVVSVPEESFKLPGETMDGETFCKHNFKNFSNATYIKNTEDFRNCRISCYLSKGTEEGIGIHKLKLALDGSPCDEKNLSRVCKNAVCV
ncbi:venom metalloproteinase antarease-like TserMP_B [Haemaphysalis longicornis]